MIGALLRFVAALLAIVVAHHRHIDPSSHARGSDARETTTPLRQGLSTIYG
jgi:hypothetical protein